MTIRVRLFAILRERAGDVGEITLELPPGARARDVAARVSEKHPALRALLPRVAFAVNREYVDADRELNDGDELALIPPVSGG
jgi:molybdopterin converting factor subunit 1